MKPFKLEEFISNEKTPVITKYTYCKVTIVKTDCRNADRENRYPVAAIIEGPRADTINLFDKDGICRWAPASGNPYTLIFDDKPKKGIAKLFMIISNKLNK